MTEFSTQVERTHYDFPKYMSEERWMSQYRQVAEIFNLKSTSVLEVGPGALLLKNILAAYAPDITYTSVDIDPALNPDVVGSATNIPLPDASVDVACAFQVLEHIPFEDFKTALAELCRVSRGDVLMSLPHASPHVAFHIKVPLISRIRFAMKIPFPRKHTFDGQHYWEVGKRGYSLKAVRRAISAVCMIEKEYVPFGNQNHVFYVLKKEGRYI